MATRRTLMGDTRRILRVCRDCGFLLFCRMPECPVCGRQLEVCQDTNSDLDLPTLDALYKPFLGKGPQAIENFLQKGKPSQLPLIRLANVQPDPFAKHFMAHRNLVGICSFCDVIQVSNGNCRFCRRILSFYLSDQDTLKQKTIDLAAAKTFLQKMLAGLPLHENSLMLLASNHIVSDSWNKSNPDVMRRDLEIQIYKGDPLVEDFFADVKDFLERKDLREFEDIILFAELKRAKVSAEFLLSFWSEEDQLKLIWGNPDEARLSLQLQTIYFEKYHLFVKGMGIVAAGWQTEKQSRKRKRLEGEYQARMALYAHQREKAAQPKEVSDWWLNRDRDVATPKLPTPYVARSWKNRWRKPW